MSPSRSTGDLVAALSSQDTATQIEAIEHARAFVGEFVDALVECMRRSERAIFIAERIPAFGSLAIPSLRRAFVEDQRAETKTIAAAVLLRLGAFDGVDWLRGRLLHSADGDEVILSSGALALARVPGIVEDLRARLLSLDPVTQVELVIALLDRFRTMDGTIPDDLILRYSSADMPPRLRQWLSLSVGGRE